MGRLRFVRQVDMVGTWKDLLYWTTSRQATEDGLIEVLNLHPGAENRQQDRVQHIFAVILMVLAPPGSGHKGPWLRLEVSKPR